MSHDRSRDETVVICHRVVWWDDEAGERHEIHGLKLCVVPANFGAGMGLIVDDGNDPYQPEEMRLFVNASGYLVVNLPSYEDDDIPAHTVRLWLSFDEGWRETTKWGHYAATPEDVAKNETRCGESTVGICQCEFCVDEK